MNGNERKPIVPLLGLFAELVKLAHLGCLGA